MKGTARIRAAETKNIAVHEMYVDTNPLVSTPISMANWNAAVENPRYVFWSFAEMCLVT